MNVLKDKSFSLAIEIVGVYKYLIEEKTGICDE
jgi:hypothetical protein